MSEETGGGTMNELTRDDIASLLTLVDEKSKDARLLFGPCSPQAAYWDEVREKLKKTGKD